MLLLATCAAAGGSADAWVSRMGAHWDRWEAFNHQGTREWSLLDVTEELDSDGRVTSTETLRYQVVRVEGRAYHRLVEHNGVALPPDEARREQRDEQEFRDATRQARRAGRALPEDRDHIRLDAAFLRKYDFSEAGDAPCGEASCRLLVFKARPAGGLTLRPQALVLRHLEGRAWADPVSGGVPLLEARLPFPVRIGLVAVVIDQVDLRYQQRMLDEGTWVPARVELTLNGRALFKRFHQRRVATWQWDRPAP
ncbi:MAG: hypothetical protein HY904_20575 [Deltaproteobacteria bacterium]|nr:hypothetical protein [Deltaproteobacteria bacterium]